MSDTQELIQRMEGAWPPLADGLFDFLADIDTPDEQLAFLDSAIHAARLLAESQPLWYCQAHQATSWSENGCWVEQMGPEPCRLVAGLLVVPLDPA